MGVLIRRNAIIVLMCVELMLNAVNLLLAAFSTYLGDAQGQLLVFFIMVVAAAEAARLPKTVVGIIGSGSVLAAFVLSVFCFNEVAATGKGLHSLVYNWLTVGNLQINFSFLVDQLSVWMMLIITGIGFLIHVYSTGYMHDDEGFYKFFAYLNLFIFSMLLLVMGSNFVMMFFGWEGVGLCSYLLIGFWYTNKEYGKAARAMGKSAQIPLYTWLPDAMAGPTPVSALIHAATMVTAGIYLVTRCNALYDLSHTALMVVAAVGLATSIWAALIGLRQNDIKKVLAYSTVSQLGLMFLALGMGAYTTAMFHVTTHAFFKALLFLAAGSVIHGLGGDQDIRNMGGLRKAMPITFVVFLIGALSMLLWSGRLAGTIALGLSLVQLAVTLYALSNFHGPAMYSHEVNLPWIPEAGINFRLGLDGISMVLVLLTSLLVPFIIVSSTLRKYHNESLYYGLLLLMQAGLTGVFMALDGLVFYIFYELALIPIYFICAIWGGADRIRITMKFFIYTFLGSLLMLVSLIYLYLHTPGNHSFAYEALHDVHLTTPAAYWVFAGIFAAFAIKIPIFPFHTWQPDTYVAAPTGGTMLLSGIMLKMGAYGLIRWLIPLAPEAMSAFVPVLITLSVIGVIYASIIAIQQRDIKRLIAYSSIAHVGLIAAGIFAWNKMGLHGSVIQMFNHGINVVGLFLVCDIIERRLGSRSLSDMGGIAKNAPVFATLFLIILLGSIAVPLTNGFVGEFLLLYGVWDYNHWLGAVAGLTIIFGAVYMLRVYGLSMFGPTNEETANFPDLDIKETIVLGSRRDDLRGNEAALKYFLMGAFATGIFLFGTALVYGATATFDIQTIGNTLALHKAAPFHFWAPDVYQGSPNLVTLFMSTLVKIAGFAAFYRLFSIAYAAEMDTWGPVVAMIAVMTMVIANFSAIFQKSFKRMMAYSGISHAGYLMLGILAIGVAGSAGALFLYITTYAIATIIAFAVFILISEQQGDEQGFSAFNGLGKSHPYLAAAMAVSMLTLAGIPPTAGFFGKYFLFSAAFERYPWLVVVAVLHSAISIYYYFKILAAMYFTDDMTDNYHIQVPVAYKVVIAVAVALLVLLSVVPGGVMSLVNH
ncbi:unnamed protein product, partial [Darwinula stevensoni]